MEKNYEEYIAELETELSDAKQSNAALRERVDSQDIELARYKDAHSQLWGEFRRIVEENVNTELREKEQDAITAWAMGFE